MIFVVIFDYLWWFQLCLEKESSSSSSTSTQASSGETYWSYRSKGEASCSLPTFTSNIPFLQDLHNKRLSQIHDTRPEIQVTDQHYPLEKVCDKLLLSNFQCGNFLVCLGFPFGTYRYGCNNAYA